MDTYTALLKELKYILETLFQLKAYDVSLSNEEIKQLLQLVQSVEIKLEELKCGS